MHKGNGYRTMKSISVEDLGTIVKQMINGALEDTEQVAKLYRAIYEELYYEKMTEFEGRTVEHNSTDSSSTKIYKTESNLNINDRDELEKYAKKESEINSTEELDGFLFSGQGDNNNVEKTVNESSELSIKKSREGIQSQTQISEEKIVITKSKLSEKSLNENEQSEKLLNEKEQSEQFLNENEQSEKSLNDYEQSERSLNENEQSEKSLNENEQSEKSLNENEQSEKSLNENEQSEKSLNENEQSQKSLNENKQSEKSLNRNEQKNEQAFDIWRKQKMKAIKKMLKLEEMKKQQELAAKHKETERRRANHEVYLRSRKLLETQRKLEAMQRLAMGDDSSRKQEEKNARIAANQEAFKAWLKRKNSESAERCFQPQRSRPQTAGTRYYNDVEFDSWLDQLDSVLHQKYLRERRYRVRSFYCQPAYYGAAALAMQ